MKYFKDLALPLIAFAMVVLIGLFVNPVQAEPCGCSQSDDLYAIATEVPDATSSDVEGDLPPVTMNVEPGASDDNTLQTMPVKTSIDDDSPPVHMEISDTPPDGGCGAPPPRRGVEGIDEAEKDPRFIRMAQELDPESLDYDQCLNLFAFVITTSEKIQKADAEGNEEETNIWKNSMYEAIGYFKDLGIDPAPLEPEFEAADLSLNTTGGAVSGTKQPCTNCGTDKSADNTPTAQEFTNQIENELRHRLSGNGNPWVEQVSDDDLAAFDTDDYLPATIKQLTELILRYNKYHDMEYWGIELTPAEQQAKSEVIAEMETIAPFKVILSHQEPIMNKIMNSEPEYLQMTYEKYHSDETYLDEMQEQKLIESQENEYAYRNETQKRRLYDFNDLGKEKIDEYDRRIEEATDDAEKLRLEREKEEILKKQLRDGLKLKAKIARENGYEERARKIEESIPTQWNYIREDAGGALGKAWEYLSSWQTTAYAFCSHIRTSAHYNIYTSVYTYYVTRTGSIGANSNYRYYVYCYTGRCYTFTFCEGGGSAAFDTYLCIGDYYGGAITSNDDACGTPSECSWTPSTTYYDIVEVAGYSSSSGSYRIAYKYALEPIGPTSASANRTSFCVGPTITLTASGGSGSGDYYWTRGSRGTCGTYIRTGNGSWTPGVGTHHVYVERRNTNFCGVNRGSTAYRHFYVYVYAQPTISISGGGGTVCWGSSQTLTASTSGGGGCSYQWQYSTNGTTFYNISGATGSTYAANPSTYGVSTEYRCRRICTSYNCNDPYSNERWVYLYNNGTAQGTWVGGYGTNWADCRNWGRGRIPTSGIAVTIPSSCTYYPVLTSSLGVGTSSYTYDCASLTINSGGSVTGTNTNFYTWLYGTLDINSGGTFHQNFNTSGRMEIRSGGKLQVDGGTCYIGSNSGYGYSDIYLRTGGEVEVNSGTLRIDDRLYVESGATVDLNGGNTYVKYRGRGDGDHGFRLRSGATLTMDGSPNLYICGAYSTSTSYCGLYFHTSSNVTCNGGFIRFLNGTGYTHSFYVNFGGKTARYVYNDKSTNYVYTCGNMNCYQLRANQGRFYVRNAVYASNNVYTYNAGRIYLDNASSSLSGYSYDLNNTGGLYVSNGTCTCRYRFYKYNGAYAQFSGGTTNIAREYYNYGTLGNTTVNGGTLNFGTAGNYYSYNYNGKFYVTSGTVDLDYVWKQENGFTSNLTQIDGGTVSVQHLQNYDGVISHSGGTLNISQYYRENDAGGGIYYGRLTAVMNLTGSSYLRLTRAGSYFNHVNVNGTYYIETGSTQNFDINGNFTINLGKSFDTNGRTMYVAKNWTNSGTFTHDNNIVRFDGSTNSTISGPTIFYELEVNKTNNTYWVKPAASTELHITNLDVSHLGTFDATNTGLNIRTP